MPLLFPGVKGEAISRSALGARAGLSAAISKVEGGCAAVPAKQLGDLLLSVDEEEATQAGSSSNELRMDR